MVEKEIALLRELIDRLNNQKFDLDAWKNHAEVYLEPIYGKDSSLAKMIRELRYDNSSWSLRDASGAGKPSNPVLVQAKEILEAAIVSLQQFGIPEKEDETGKAWNLVEEELTGKQVKELRAIVQSDDPAKNEKIIEILKTLDGEKLAKIVAGILLP